MSELIGQIVQVLKEQVVQDTVVPRNIRRAAEGAIDVLLDENKEPAVRAAVTRRLISASWVKTSKARDAPVGSASRSEGISAGAQRMP